MTMWTPKLDRDAAPIYLRIADALGRDVGSGALAAGERLPTHRALAFRLGVTVGTVSRAYAEAERRGLISSTVGRGTFVRSVLQAGTVAAAALPQAGAPAAGHAPFNQMDAGDQGSGPSFDLALNYPWEQPFRALLGETFGRLSDPAGLTAMGRYHPAVGMAAHRDAARTWLSTLGVEAARENVLITPGCQGGLTAILVALCRPGDTILREALTWPGVLATTGALGIASEAVPMDAAGLLPDALDCACRAYRPRLLYMMATLHNPTTTVMPDERRHAVIEVARRHELLIVEDDVYGFLLDRPATPLCHLAPERALYVTSLSKALAPGLRIGYVVAPETLTGRIAAGLQITVLTTSSVAAEIASEAIRSGAAARAAEAQREEARARQQLASAILGTVDSTFQPTAFHRWLRVPEPWCSDAFMAALRDRGVAVTPGSAFATPPMQAAAERHVRLCLMSINEREHLAAALHTVADVARAGAAPSALPVV